MYFWKTAAANNSWACTKAEHPKEFYKGGRGNWGRVALLWSKARHLTGEPVPLCTVLPLHQWGQKENVQNTGQKRISMQEPLGSLKPRQGHSNCNLQVLLAIITYFSILKPRSCIGSAFWKPTSRVSHQPWQGYGGSNSSHRDNHTCGWQRLPTRKPLKWKRSDVCSQEKERVERLNFTQFYKRVCCWIVYSRLLVGLISSLAQVYKHGQVT